MSLYPRDKAIIALSDGTVEHGFAIGKKGTTGGELCFNTPHNRLPEDLHRPPATTVSYDDDLPVGRGSGTMTATMKHEK
ncbi:MAG: hypothetical protein U5K69_29680 [Balneolaceae bacterium]|nr:hypothetical protein [Balneolaceae bacterium]